VTYPHRATGRRLSLRRLRKDESTRAEQFAALLGVGTTELFLYLDRQQRRASMALQGLSDHATGV
jgi:hypothetical protein